MIKSENTWKPLCSNGFRRKDKKTEIRKRKDLPHGMQKVTGSTPVFSTFPP
jgi:hypothetical protein